MIFYDFWVFPFNLFKLLDFEINFGNVTRLGDLDANSKSKLHKIVFSTLKFIWFAAKYFLLRLSLILALSFKAIRLWKVFYYHRHKPNLRSNLRIIYFLPN